MTPPAVPKLAGFVELTNVTPVPPPVSEGRKGRGCLFYGCLSVLLLLLLLSLGVFFGVRYAINRFVSIYTESSPLSLPTSTLSPAEVATLEARVTTFGEKLRAGETVPPLALTASELNALIAKNPQLTDKLRVSFENDRINAQVSVPLGNLPVPIVQNWLQGRYLNGVGGIGAAIEKGELVLKLHSLSVSGQPVPATVITRIEQAFIEQRANMDARSRDLIKRLESLEIDDDRLILKPKTED